MLIFIKYSDLIEIEIIETKFNTQNNFSKYFFNKFNVCKTSINQKYGK
jgi:hypothetical protein